MSRGKAGGADGLSIDLISIFFRNACKPIPYQALGKIYNNTYLQEKRHESLKILASNKSTVCSIQAFL